MNVLFPQFVEVGVGLYMKRINKVMLINAFSSDVGDTRKLQPLGIAYLCSSLRKNNIKCDTLDMNLDIQNMNADFVVKKIIEEKYDFIGFSVVTANFSDALSVAKKIKEKTSAIICMGGVFPTIQHEQILNQEFYIDLIIRGEAEHAIVKVIKDFNVNGKFSTAIDGCSYQNLNGKKHFCSEINKITLLDTLPFPDRENAFLYSKRKLSNYKTDLKNIPVASSRGCPYSCTFCSVPSLGLNWRGRDPENVAEEIYEMYKIDSEIFIVFIDDNFFVDYKRALEIAFKIKEKCGKPVPFSFATRADQIIRAGSETISKLREYGCEAIEIGIENGSDSVLLRMNKKISVVQNKEALKILKNNGIAPGVDFILFDDETTLEELEENIVFLKDNMLFGYYPTLVYSQMFPYVGTKFHEKGVDMTNYFKNVIVSDIYDQLIKFQNKCQSLIDKVVKDTAFIEDRNMEIKIDYIYVQTAPYVYLNYLIEAVKNNWDITNDNEIDSIYEKVSAIHDKYCDNKEEKIDER